MRIVESNFGETSTGEMAQLFSLQNSNGMIVNITNYGGIVTAIYTPDSQGNFDNICLGFKSMDGYRENPAYFGAIIGRYANRIDNGTFKIDNHIFQLSKNDGTHHLHGGHAGFNTKLWEATHSQTASSAKLELQYLSIDGEEGYPGNCNITATYELNELDELSLTFNAVCDQPTPINLTQHSYFNLYGSGDVLSHRIIINADFYSSIDKEHIPTGNIHNVTGSPLDLRDTKNLRELIDLTNDQLEIGKGFNHYFFIGKDPFHHTAKLNLAARISEPASGRTLEIYTDEPGVQFYSSGFLMHDPHKIPSGFPPYSGICIEPQNCPNALNNPLLPNTILQPGKLYKSETRYRFFNAD